MFEQINEGASNLPTLGAYRAMTPVKRREMREGLMFISPWLFGFFAFTFLPILASLIFSFMDLSITDGIFATPKFVGFENYADLMKDPQIWRGGGGTPGSMWITVKFGLIALPVSILVPLGLALLMNSPYLKGQQDGARRDRRRRRLHFHGGGGQRS